MKREIAFIASMIISGVVLGVTIVSLLGAIAVDFYKNTILTLNEKTDFALMNGYYSFWDVKKGIEQLFKNSDEMLIPRLILISTLRHLPVTQENLNYLKAFTDESRWHIGGDIALRIAEAFMHFGMVDEAKAWVEKARAKGEDISKVTFLDDKALTDGKITGAVKVNGKPLANSKIALLRYTENFGKIEDMSLPSKLLDVCNLDRSGKFTFDKLGKGEYMLAIMTDKEIIPYDIPQEKLSVYNYPRIMKLSADTPSVNLGDINIVLK